MKTLVDPGHGSQRISAVFHKCYNDTRMPEMSFDHRWRGWAGGGPRCPGLGQIRV